MLSLESKNLLPGKTESLITLVGVDRLQSDGCMPRVPHGSGTFFCANETILIKQTKLKTHINFLLVLICVFNIVDNLLNGFLFAIPPVNRPKGHAACFIIKDFLLLPVFNNPGGSQFNFFNTFCI